MGGMPSAVWAQTWPTRVQDIVDAFAAMHPELVQGDDEQRRTLTGFVAEQVVCEFGRNWGRKRADPGRPISVDVIATQSPFVGWDFQISGGVIARFPQAIDLSGQVFVPVECVNRLNAGQPPPGPILPPPVVVNPPPTVDLSGLNAKVDAIAAELHAHVEASEAHWAEAKGIWEHYFRPALAFAGKYIAPAIIGILTGMQMEKTQ